MKEGHLLPKTTASFDSSYHYECPSWMALERNDNNFAIGSFYRFDEISIMQQIYSSNFAFVEMQFIHINQLCKSTLYMAWLEDVFFFWVSLSTRKDISTLLCFHQIPNTYKLRAAYTHALRQWGVLLLVQPYNILPLVTSIDCAQKLQPNRSYCRHHMPKRQNSIIAMA